MILVLTVCFLASSISLADSFNAAAANQGGKIKTFPTTAGYDLGDLNNGKIGDKGEFKPVAAGSYWEISFPEERTITSVRFHLGKTLEKAGEPFVIRLTFADGSSFDTEVYENSKLPYTLEQWRWIRVPRIVSQTVRMEIMSLTAKSLEKAHGVCLDEIEVWVLGSGATTKTASTKPIEVSVTPGAAPKSVWRPFGNCYQTAYCERGVSEGFTIPETRKELIERLQQMGVQALRFPGGSYAYAYPPVREAMFQAMGCVDYSHFGRGFAMNAWAGPKDFMSFCKDGGFVANYQIDPGFWYDRETRRFYRIRNFTGPHYFGHAEKDRLPEAVRDVQDLARWAKEQNISVLWEVGNEDASWYAPEDFAQITSTFIKGIKEVDPKAKFVVYGDSYSWQDRSYQDKFLPALKKAGIKDFDYSSVHLYLNVPTPAKSGADLFANSVSQWKSLYYMFVNAFQKQVNKYGYKAQITFNEFNVFYPPAQNQALEHTAGRGLAEAIIFPWVWELGGITYHDLVRTGQQGDNWFQRLDYYPDMPAGRRYYLQMDGEMMAQVMPHGLGKIVYVSPDRRIVVSRQKEGLHMSVVNPEAVQQPITLTIAKDARWNGMTAEVTKVYTDSMESMDYDYYMATEKVTVSDKGTCTFSAEPYSVTGVRIILSK